MLDSLRPNTVSACRLSFNRHSVRLLKIMFDSLLRLIGFRSSEVESMENTHKLDIPRANFASLKSSFDEASEDLEARTMSMADPKPGLEAAENEIQILWTANRREKLCMVTCAVASLIVALDATILVPVLPTLAVDLHGTAADAFVSHSQHTEQTDPQFFPLHKPHGQIRECD